MNSNSTYWQAIPLSSSDVVNDISLWNNKWPRNAPLRKGNKKVSRKSIELNMKWNYHKIEPII